ncbi:MAG: pilin [Patescibacteria group bacterium]|nr:pilin [Patescibacteria group bacterium]
MLNFLKILIIVPSLFFAFCFSVQAETLPVKLTPAITIPDSDFQSGVDKTVNESTICEYIVAWYKYLIGIVGIIALVTIAVGGVLWVTSAGNPGKIGAAKSWIKDSLYGLIIALLAYTILSLINKDLVICKPLYVKKVVNIALKNDTTVYGEAGKKDEVVAKHLDSSGEYKCCVIHGKLFTPDFGLNGMYCGSGGMMSGLKKCATYESASQTASQTECNDFYKAYDEFSPLLKKICKFEKGPLGSSGGLWSATIYEGKCWENSATKDWCMSNENPKYCLSHPEAKCKLPDGTIGWCSSTTCNPCRKFGDSCSNGGADFECSGNETELANLKSPSLPFYGEEGLCGGRSNQKFQGDCFCNLIGGNCTCTYHKN